MFFEDAEIASKELGLTLTTKQRKRRQIPLAGYRIILQVHIYQSSWVAKGYKVAICEQTENPMMYDSKKGNYEHHHAWNGNGYDVLDAKSNNYLVAIKQIESKLGINFIWT